MRSSWHRQRSAILGGGLGAALSLRRQRKGVMQRMPAIRMFKEQDIERRQRAVVEKLRYGISSVSQCVPWI